MLQNFVQICTNVLPKRDADTVGSSLRVTNPFPWRLCNSFWPTSPSSPPLSNASNGPFLLHRGTFILNWAISVAGGLASQRFNAFAQSQKWLAEAKIQNKRDNLHKNCSREMRNVLKFDDALKSIALMRDYCIHFSFMCIA